MAVEINQIFNFYKSNETYNIRRVEVLSPLFMAVKYNSIEIINLLDDADDRHGELVEQIRIIVCEWLTVPVNIDISYITYLEGILGKLSTARSRWGSDFYFLYKKFQFFNWTVNYVFLYA